MIGLGGWYGGSGGRPAAARDAVEGRVGLAGFEWTKASIDMGAALLDSLFPIIHEAFLYWVFARKGKSISGKTKTMYVLSLTLAFLAIEPRLRRNDMLHVRQPQQGTAMQGPPYVSRHLESIEARRKTTTNDK